ncbi:T9SS type A sorting domain-containing protein [Flavobacterium sp. SUN046]|uniref:DUF7619 domain-containing protein n=1 Tax=Flavobacterium sp. SUN046 TaxID=3002440 RepID=UPI002DBDFD80|nr:T9SS type A sorting domain-containing protein [Flavobacterium sp. SUN046]MEC4049151.1 T9SS type A sorting domain-containing protein [Flavobacterium sp. SUN046]
MKKHLLLSILIVLFTSIFSAQAQTPVCGDVFMDPGQSSNYANNTDYTVTIYPTNPGDKVTVTFTSFNIEPNYDGLYIFDGNSINAPQIASANAAANIPGGLAGAYWGTAIPGPFTSTSSDGSLTFHFITNASFVKPGWVANVSCIASNTCVSPNSLQISNITTMGATLGWVEQNNATQWEVLTIPLGNAPPLDSQSGTVCTTNPYVISNQISGSSFNTYVRSKCSDTQNSSWSNPKTFSTLHCAAPTNLTISNITDTGATIYWVNTNLNPQWEIIVQLDTETAPTSTATGTILTTNSYPATGLIGNSTYKAYVRGYCDTFNASSWSPISFTTAPPDIPTPVCGGQFTDNGGIDTNYLNNSNANYVICPNNPTDVVTVSFTSFDVESISDALYVYNGNSINAPQIPSNITSTGGAFWGTTIPGPFTSTSPDGCLTFKFISDSSITKLGWVANVQCSPSPSCQIPYSLHITNINYTEAIINWTAISPSTQWEVIIQSATAAPPTASSTGTLTSNSSYNLTGLTPNTAYAVYVRTICSTTDSSVWSNAINFTTKECQIPNAVNISYLTSTSVKINWSSNSTGPFEVVVSTSNNTPSNTDTGVIVNTNSYQVTGLTCETNYHVYIRSLCTDSLISPWTNAYNFTTTTCFITGTPLNLSQCSDTSQSCFDFTNNGTLVMANLDPSVYSIAYYINSVDATNQNNPISNPTNYCITGTAAIYLRITNTITQVYKVKTFTITATTFSSSTVTALNSMSLCDNNPVNAFIFNLTTAATQINTTNPKLYYNSINDAIANTNPIADPTNYSLSVSIPTTTIYIRDFIDGTCDRLYSLILQAYTNCNLAYNCNDANSLCSTLGTPFSNTHLGISNGTMNCLGTTPNPTWFYLPVSSPGTISLVVEQNSGINFNANSLDVDYIIYGPFSNPVTPCASSLIDSNVVSCSYSVAAVEYPTIHNAQVGQYYLLMTTNYSNLPGFIRISMNDNSTGAIECSGLRLRAFVDSNNNGTPDTNEQNFPLGGFHYNVNNGTPHNITTPNGTYNIYDANNTNIYNLSYFIDPQYTSMYGLAINSYNNVTVSNTGGMTTYNFPIINTGNYNEVSVTLTPMMTPISGEYYFIKISYTNNGNQTIPTGTITYTNSPGTPIINISQTDYTNTPTGFTYNYSNLLPFETRTITVKLYVPPIPTTYIGEQLTYSASITPFVGDMITQNNTSATTQTVFGAYDPNDKTESHGDRILISEFTPDDYLYYTIRFENTGTSSAINVQLNDNLDSKLDETTVKMFAASHPYTLDRINNNLTWKFNNIQLPVSIANTETGKGYVTFGVKPKAGYSVGDIIPNTAAIYFDSNPAIITNTFNTEFVTTLSTSAFGSNGFMVYPNPATSSINISLPNNNDSISEVIIHDMLGKNIKEIKNIADVTTTVDVSNLAKGVYLVEIKTASGFKQSQKLIVR